MKGVIKKGKSSTQGIIKEQWKAYISRAVE
jgi:hypothetical protein